MEPFNTGRPAIRQYPRLELPHWYYSKILRLSFVTHRYNLYRTTRLESGFRHTKKHLSLRYGALPGDPCGNRTHVNGVRGRCLNRLTNGPKKREAGIYLFSQAVSSQLSSAQVSLTSVFGMGTGGSSPSSTPAIP